MRRFIIFILKNKKGGIMRIPYCNVCGTRITSRVFSITVERPYGVVSPVLDLCEKCLVEHCDYEIMKNMRAEVSAEHYWQTKRKKGGKNG